MLLAVIAVLVFAVIVVVAALAGKGNGRRDQDSSVGDISSAEEENGTGTEDERSTDSETDAGGDESLTEKESGAGDSAQDGTDNVSGSTSGIGEDISFPYVSSIDELELEAVYNYSGYYIEDGSEDEIDSVAVLEVTNTSSQVIEYGTIALTADGKTLNFEVSLLPAGATALVMEADRQSCNETAAFSYGGSEIADLTELDLCEDQVSLSTDGTGAITVTNISGTEISELRLFYKNKLETGEYVGGIAYTVKLEDLAAGESRTVYPSHFDPDAGEVMMVRIYE